MQEMIFIIALIIPNLVNAEDYHTRYYQKMKLVGYIEVPDCDYPSAKICVPNEEEHERHCVILQDKRCI